MTSSSEYAAMILERVGPAPNGEDHSISELLTKSQSAHNQYRWHTSRMSEMTGGMSGTVGVMYGDAIEARVQLATAARFRALAERADPAHADIAWQTNGVTHQAFASHADLHDKLLEFYLTHLHA